MNIDGNIEDRFSDWTRQVLKEIKDPGQQAKVARAIALKFIQKVVPETPVETGRARGGWTAMPAARNVASGEKVAEGRSMSDYKEHLGGEDWRLEIINGVPYVVWLELGSSMQAPAGMVRKTLFEMMQPLKAAELRRMEAAFRLANRKARKEINLVQGSRPGAQGRTTRVRG